MKLLSIVFVLTLLALIAPSCAQGASGGYGGYGAGNGADGSQGYGYAGIDPRVRPYGGYQMNGNDGRGSPFSYNGGNGGRYDGGAFGSGGYGYNRNYYYSSATNLHRNLIWFLLPTFFLIKYLNFH